MVKPLAGTTATIERALDVIETILTHRPIRKLLRA
jgi:hypothetical protein